MYYNNLTSLKHYITIQYYRVLSTYAEPISELVSSEFACPYSTPYSEHEWIGWRRSDGHWRGSTNFELEQIGKN